MMETLGLYNYWVVVVLMMTGFYIVVARDNLIKKVIGLNIFQTSVFLLFISAGTNPCGGYRDIFEPSPGSTHTHRYRRRCSYHLRRPGANRSYK